MSILLRERPILLVEDNADDELLTIRALRRAGIVNTITVARNGEEAIQFLTQVAESQDPSTLPIVVLLDLKLPKVSGLEVLTYIRSVPFLRLLSVVILTSSSEEWDVVEGYNLGANSYVRKPVKSDRFFDAVRQLGLYWVLINEPTIPKGSPV
jgi:two-component system, response regulator